MRSIVIFWLERWAAGSWMLSRESRELSHGGVSRNGAVLAKALGRGRFWWWIGRRVVSRKRANETD